MIEIIDKINNIIKKVENLEVVIHPGTNQIFFLEDFQISGARLTAVIIDKIGILFTYKNIEERIMR